MARGPDGICAGIALIPLAIHSLVEYPFAYAYFFIFSGILVGIVEFHHSSKNCSLSISPRLAGLITIICFLVGSRVVYEYLQIEEDFAVVRFENLRIGHTPPEYSPPQNIVLLNQLGTMLNAARLRPTQNMLPTDIETLRTASSRFSYGALRLRYAQALGLNGQPEAATHQLQVIYGMYGDYYYQAAASVIRSMEDDYPEIKRVLTP
jgi:hypothetical protein